MAEEIDIEEHDVLDNPIIRNMFPDLTILKREIDDYFNEASTKNSEPTSTFSDSIELVTADKKGVYNCLNTEPIGIVKEEKTFNYPDSSVFKNDYKHSNKTIDESRPADKIPHENLILQIKENCKESLYFQIKVTLNDVSPYLGSSDKYCKECLILYPSTKELRDHMDLIHQDNASNILPIQIKKRRFLKRAPKKLNCNSCMKIFSSMRTVRNHYKNTHNGTINPPSKNIVTHAYVSSNKNRKNISKSFCSHCGNLFPNMNALIDHMYDVLKEKKKITSTYSPTLRETVQGLEDTSCEKGKVNNAYKCQFCACYFRTAKWYLFHTRKRHKVSEITNLSKVPINLNCKNCLKEFISVEAYNKHIYKNHIKQKTLKRTEVKKKIKSKEEKLELIFKTPTQMQFSKSYAFKSTLFKCLLCDIHFLSVNTAMKHSKHVDVVTHWTCNICHRIFKENDKFCHKIQHIYSDELNVCNVDGSSYLKVLLKCLRCTVHFSEERYVLHSATCGSTVCSSTYCRVCNILIDEEDMSQHKYSHNLNYDYVIIGVYGLIDTENESEDIINYMSFTNSSEKPGYVYGRSKTSCHTYTEVSKERINLRILEYSKCQICSVHYLNKDALLRHKCRSNDYSLCHVCNLKFSKSIYELHIPLYGCSLNNIKTNFSSNSSSNVFAISSKKVSPNTITSMIPNSNDDVIFKKLVPTKLALIMPKNLFICKKCDIAIDTYDKVVHHCQVHCQSKKKVISLQCNICSLRFIVTDYASHQKLHQENQWNETSLKLCNYDNAYFIADNEIWTKHLFNTLTDKDIKEITENSLYKHEHRIKLHIVQDGATELTVYKCAKCNCFIDQSSLFNHTEILCTAYLKKHPCLICGLPFISIISRINHEKIHETSNVGSESYKIISFNRDEDILFNKNIISTYRHHLLYQCRTCDVTVSKEQVYKHKSKCKNCNIEKCKICGLFMYKEEYDLHVSKHKDLNCFDKTILKVILFGERMNKKKEIGNKILPSFGGVIIDYTFYKCSKCGICVSHLQYLLKHICILEGFITKCPKCPLYLCTKNLSKHVKHHKRELEFTKDHINIITVDMNKLSDQLLNKDPKFRKSPVVVMKYDKNLIINNKLSNDATDNINIHSECFKISDNCFNDSNKREDSVRANVDKKVDIF